MKVRNQKEAARAAEKYQAWAQQSKKSIQVRFPSAAMIELMKQSFGRTGGRRLGDYPSKKCLKAKPHNWRGRVQNQQ